MHLNITTGKIPIKLWLGDLEEGALEQAQRLAELPFAFHHVAVMPDSHRGYGMPIGGVLATREVVVPNGVGVDIGCGICALKTSLEVEDAKECADLIKSIKRLIPLGFSWHKRPQPEGYMPQLEVSKSMQVVFRHYQAARRQLGSLGGGNHFIELQRGTDRRIWLMIHSGSRNLGKQVAEYYNRLAGQFNGWHGLEVPPKWQLSFLPLETVEGQDYLQEMNYCVAFARASRIRMLELAQSVLLDFFPETRFERPIHAIHNYAAMEHHFGEEVIVHRKGAIRAGSGDLGIVPGSQGTPSYIVRGRGNPESFSSCAHGAGRCLGRNQARKRLDLGEEKNILERQGILHNLHKKKDLDEAPGAYKDIDEVMNNQADLVEIVEKLQPLAVIKG